MSTRHPVRPARPRPSARWRLTALTAPLLLLVACGTSPGSEPAAPDAHDAHDAHEQASETELRAPTSRALLAHADGLTLLDATSGETLDSVERPGFLRLNDAGNGRHALVTDGNRFLVYDTGLHSSAHGDHSHHYASTPSLTDTVWPATEGGHVVAHNGFTTLFADGTGEITSIDSEHLAEPDALVQRHRTEHAHHGVALVLDDGSLLTTQGTEQERHRVEVLDGQRSVARTDDCPGVHGEATAAPTTAGTDVVVLGCENGPVVWRDGSFHKVRTSGYLRTGTLAGHPDSPIVLGDAKTDAAAAATDQPEHPTAVALIDTRRDTLRTVELGSSYWFRSLARGPEGEALVLTQDGSLRVIDPASGRESAPIKAIAAWTEPADWQQPGPVLKVAGEQAYIADPAANQLVVIDLADGVVTARHPIPEGTAELVVTTGSAAGASHDHAH